jgi:hypothetical protein
MRKFSLCLFSVLFFFSVDPAHFNAEAAKGKISHKRSDFTPQQRAKMMEEARKLCKKRYGASSTVYKFDYYKWMVICNEH